MGYLTGLQGVPPTSAGTSPIKYVKKYLQKNMSQYYSVILQNDLQTKHNLKLLVINKDRSIDCVIVRLCTKSASLGMLEGFET